MRKLGMIIALLPLITASSAFAGDFEQAAQAGYGPTSITAAWIAITLIVIGSIAWLLWDRRTRLPVISATAVVAATIAGHAGDFERAADAGYRAWSGRSSTAISGINAIGRANDYMGSHQLEALDFVYRFSDTSSTTRATAGAMLHATETRGAGSMAGPVGDLRTSSIYSGYAGGALGSTHYTTVCSY